MHKLLRLSLVLLGPLSLLAQNGPIDFETGGQGATWNWTVFENDTNPPLEIIPNPDPSGINQSATVAKFTALQAGNPWAGCESLHGAGTGSFLIDANNAQIRIMVWKSVISDVGIKLVRPDGWSLGEIKVSNTLTNQWEQLTFDFSAHIGLTPAYDQVVIFPDFNARTSDEVIYFDNVFGAPASSVGLEDDATLQATRVFPNPGNGRVQVESGTFIEDIVVYDVLGKSALTKEVKGRTAELDLSAMPKGVYLIELRSSSDREVLRYILR